MGHRVKGSTGSTGHWIRGHGWTPLASVLLIGLLALTIAAYAGAIPHDDSSDSKSRNDSNVTHDVTAAAGRVLHRLTSALLGLRHMRGAGAQAQQARATAERTPGAVEHTYCVASEPCFHVNAISTADEESETAWTRGVGIMTGSHSIVLLLSRSPSPTRFGLESFVVDGQEMVQSVEDGLWWWSSEDAEMLFEATQTQNGRAITVTCARCGEKISVQIRTQQDERPELSLSLWRDESARSPAVSGETEKSSAAIVWEERQLSTATSRKLLADDEPIVVGPTDWISTDNIASHILGLDCGIAAFRRPADAIEVSQVAGATDVSQTAEVATQVSHREYSMDLRKAEAKRAMVTIDSGEWDEDVVKVGPQYKRPEDKAEDVAGGNEDREERVLDPCENEESCLENARFAQDRS